MALYDFPAVVFMVPHVICQEDKRDGMACYEVPKHVRVILAELGVDKLVLLVCDTVDGSTIEDPPTVIARILLAEDPNIEFQTYSSSLKIRFLLPRTQVFHLIFSEASEFWDVTGIIAEIQKKKIHNQAKEGELVRAIFGMLPSVPRVFKQEEE